MASNKVTEEQERKIHTALEMTGGSVAQASELLEVDNKWLHNVIEANKNLRDRWKKGNIEAPTESVTLHRPALPAVPEDAELMGEKEIANQLAQEDAAVKQGLTRMGIKGDILDLSAAFRDFSRRHFSSAFEVVSGGITRQYMDVVAEIISITDELKNPTPPAEGDINACAREAMLREDRTRLLDFSVKLYDRTLKAVLIAAKIKAMKRDKEGASDKPKGFLSLKAK